jgi:ubiquinone/menaquinone biosynthesis C-methylase UbiE
VQRKVVPELLDSDAGSERDVRNSLRDLQRINTLFGGVTSIVKMVRNVARETGQRQFRYLEVASGDGFVPLAANHWLASDGIQLNVSLLDRAPTHLPGNGVESYVGDALALPFADNSFDLVACNLFLHHLSSAEVPAFARESLRVARRAVLISDLTRSWFHLAIARLGLVLFRSPITWHDSLASIRAAYTRTEAHDLLSHGGARKLEIHSYYLYRMGAILWK